MKITFLGTGTSQGIPIISCECEVCKSTDKKDKRLRTSVLIETEGNVFTIDAGPDFRQQMLRADVKKLDAIILTHSHKDHIGGMDDVRAYNYSRRKPMDIYAEKNVLEYIKTKEYSYVFDDNPYPGVPQMSLHKIENNPFFINDIKIIPIRGYHRDLPVLGFKIGKFAYITDMNSIPKQEMTKLENLDVFVINALRKTKHISHFTLSEALEIIEEIKPKKSYLTHISHDMGFHREEQKLVPENVYFAYDELQIYL